LALWKMREDIDEETSCNHMAMVAWHALALLANQLRGRGTDDRSLYLTRESGQT
jgi:dATP/dGTP diphosphohydrolase